jgi:hypothetical protein
LGAVAGVGIAVECERQMIPVGILAITVSITMHKSETEWEVETMFKTLSGR